MIPLVLLAACNYPPSTKDLQSQKAKDAAESIHFDENAEIDNITRRLQLTSSPGLLGYIVLWNQDDTEADAHMLDWTDLRWLTQRGLQRLFPAPAEEARDG